MGELSGSEMSPNVIERVDATLLVRRDSEPRSCLFVRIFLNSYRFISYV